MKGHSAEEEEEHNLPTTPGPKSKLPDTSMTPKTSSPFEPTARLQSTQRWTGGDVLLHRVLDKNYRIQATPHKTPKVKSSWRDLDSPMSSPPAAAPELRAEIFSSPVRLAYNPTYAPRTPGISVQTPANGRAKDAAVSKKKKIKDKDEITWESDSDEDPEGVYAEMGMSPPKTIQFSMPQSKLMQTPGTYLPYESQINKVGRGVVEIRANSLKQREKQASRSCKTSSRPRAWVSTIPARRTARAWWR